MSSTYIRDTDRGWKRIVASARASGRNVVAVGILESTDGRSDGASNALVASTHEYGSPTQNIPERSFIRSTIDALAVVYGRMAKKLGDMVITGQLPSEKMALGIMGTRVVADIKRTIQRGVPPPLEDATIRRKKSSKPLIDTGQMINAITHEVRSR